MFCLFLVGSWLRRIFQVQPFFIRYCLSRSLGTILLVPLLRLSMWTIQVLSFPSFFSKLQNIFRRRRPPTAIFAHDDCLAARIIVALQNMQIRVPDDISIIAPGDTLDYNQPFIPRITTMRINNELMGKLAGEMLLERLKNQREDIHVLKVNQQLVKRGSCKQIP